MLISYTCGYDTYVGNVYQKYRLTNNEASTAEDSVMLIFQMSQCSIKPQSELARQRGIIL